MLEIGYVGVKAMPEKIIVCRTICVGQYVSDKMCQAEKDLKLTGEIDVEPGNINFPLGGLLPQMLQFKSGPSGISF
jgi:hypothetical protein